MTQMLFRTYAGDEFRRYHPSPRCADASCNEATREGKPYCPKHVEQHDYVQGIVELLDERDAELARVSRGGRRAHRHVDPAGMIAQEIILQLRLHGKRTAARLSRDLGLPEAAVEVYTNALARVGVVSLGRTSRNGLLVIPRNLDAVPPKPELSMTFPRRAKLAPVKRDAVA